MSGFQPFRAAAPGEAAWAALRQATAPQHAQIESVTGLSGPFGLGHYGRVLQGLHAFVRAWEPQMDQALPAERRDWFGQTPRLAWLQRDLQTLALEPIGQRPADLPELGSVPQALGSLYVMEGSALGGRVVSEQVRRRLGLQPGVGTTYFHGHGAGTALRWREFRQWAGPEIGAGAASLGEAVQAAVGTFASLIALFQQVLHEPAAA